MGSYYLFALFIFILICVVLIVCRLLFSDVKRQQKLLDEKETKLLRLYQTLEELLDEYYDSVEETKADIAVKIKELKAVESITQAFTLPAPQSEKTVSAGGAATIASIATPVVKPEDEDAGDGIPAAEFKEILFAAENGENGKPKPTRTVSILDLAEQGRNRFQIAEELGITLSEVDLVIGINRK